MSYERALREALDAALEAGELLRREFHRWGGPGGHGSHADADEEAEWLIRKRLTAAFPSYQYRGEETGSIPSEDPHVWLIDPNDGTTSFLRGARGSAVSIGLVRSGVPVLGVVYAFAAPDDRGDLIYWAEGFDLARNGAKVGPPAQQNIVLLSLHREALAESVLDCLAPYRVMAVPSIAYRLALVAAGEGAAAVSWHGPGDWDYAAGHALLRAAGSIFVDENGRDVTYAQDGSSKVRRCFGGNPKVIRDLWRRNWAQIQQRQLKPSAATTSQFHFVRPKRGQAIASAPLLSRAQGCLLGQMAGQGFGSQNPSSQATPGQPYGGSEMAILLARSLVNRSKYDRDDIAKSYAQWFHEDHPSEIPSGVAQALKRLSGPTDAPALLAEGSADHRNQTSGSLVRISPLALQGYRKDLDDVWNMACQESRLTHPHSICQQSCGVLAVALAHAIRTGDPPQLVFAAAVQMANAKRADALLLQSIDEAQIRPPLPSANSELAIVALQHAFYQLLHAQSFEEAVRNTSKLENAGPSTVTGALLGAVFGRDSIPASWKSTILSARPYSGSPQPRPMPVWPVDLLLLSELLLIAG